MSVGRKSLQYAAAAVVVAIAIIGASALYVGIQPTSTTGQPPSSQGSTSAQAGQPAFLAIRLTDPPQVPRGTSSLNLTYSSLSLLVGEPSGTSGQLTTSSVPVTGSATVDLLSLQNISQTIALAKLPAGSVVYSVTFTVSAIKIDVNGTVSTVSLATGGSSFTVTIAQPRSFESGDFALLQLNPVVVDTPSGYQLIPSAVGVMGHESGQGENEQVGSQHQLKTEDEQNLEGSRGNVTATLVALSVSGDVTTVTVQINNTGNTPVELNAVGLHGNFTVAGNPCQSTVTTTTTTTHGESQDQYHQCELPEHADEVVFVPVVPSTSTTTTTSTSTSTTTTSTTTTTTSTSTSCSSGMMSLVNDGGEDNRGMQLSPGQCVDLTFTGQLSFGESHFVLTPSTSAGQVYVVHVIASNGAEERLSCTLPLVAGSCNVISPQSEQSDG